MNAQRMLRILADGRFHSGSAIGRALGISRSAVWKQLRTLEGLGIELFAVSGRGYRLAAPLDLLDADAIRAEVEGAAARPGRVPLAGLEVVAEVDSTNRRVRQRMLEGAPAGYAVLAERQSAGRGRRGRPWVSPFAAHVCLSIGWRFPASPASLSGLPLAVGVAAVHALEGLGLDGIALKWPNDLCHRDRKLGGVLIELAGEAAGPCDVVVGVGVNVAMPATAAAQIDQPWIDLRTIMGAGRPRRNALAGALIARVLGALARYEEQGLASFLETYRRYDGIVGRRVRVLMGDRERTGIARGVDSSGALLLECGGEMVSCGCGEVSLRIAP